MPRRTSRTDGEGAVAAGPGYRLHRHVPVQPIAPVLDAMPERELQQTHVVAGLKWRGWTVMVIPDMRRVEAGWPDVTAWRLDLPGLLLAWELKTETGRASHAQKRMLRHLSSVPGVDARIVRPRDWTALRDCLDSPDPLTALKTIGSGL